MAQTQFAFVYDPAQLDENNNPILTLVVFPDDDSELADPAFNPPGQVQVQLNYAGYLAAPEATSRNSTQFGGVLLDTPPNMGSFQPPSQEDMQAMIPGYLPPAAAAAAAI